jgi:hypothetical protein
VGSTVHRQDVVVAILRDVATFASAVADSCDSDSPFDWNTPGDWRGKDP